MSTRPQTTLSPVTTKILALGNMNASITQEQREGVMKQEMPATLRLYLDGKIDQWFGRQDGPGVAFLLNVTSIEEARSLLEALPLGMAGLMRFELIPLGPLFPLSFLIS
jgi:hypothetical protein